MTKKNYNIGVEATLDVIGGKWKPIILCNLCQQPLRTSELKRKIPGISQKVLIQQLHELNDSQIINRKIYNQVPPKVEYSLSDYGKTLRPALDSLCKWGEMHVKYLNGLGENIKIIQKN